MKKILFTIAFICFLYFFSSSYFICVKAPSDNELVGKYYSEFEDKKYYLFIEDNKTSKFSVYQDNKKIYGNTCLSFYIDSKECSINFSKCNKMNSNAELKRGLMFNILIGNNGAEGDIIDPASNVYFRKIK